MGGVWRWIGGWIGFELSCVTVRITCKEGECWMVCLLACFLYEQSVR